MESSSCEYDTYSITCFDTDTDIANLNLSDSDIDEGHTEDFSIDSCSGFGLNVNTDHPPCTDGHAICHNVVHAAWLNEIPGPEPRFFKWSGWICAIIVRPTL